MEQRLSMVTLGVGDVARSRRFYEALGWQAVRFDSKDVCFFRMGTAPGGGGVVLGLYGRQALADDAGVANQPAEFSGVAIAWIGRSEEEVDETIAVAQKAGAKIVKPAEKVFWGGYSGYFEDPDGHLWEVAFNPFWTIDAAGAVHVPDAAQ